MKNPTHLSKLCIFISTIVLALGCFAGGDGVNNGGGASEMTVVYTHQNFASLVEVCWRTESCDLEMKERELLNRILNNLPLEQSVDLKFQTRAELGEKLFATASVVGSVVEINKDMLWKTGLSGANESYSLSDALELLSFAWGQHHPSFDEGLQRSLSKKLADHALNGIASYLPYFNSSNLKLLTIKRQPLNQMILEDGYESFVDLTPLIEKLLPCKPTSLSIYTFQWSHVLFQEPDAVRVLMNGRIGWKCAGNDSSAVSTATLTVVLRTVPVTGTLQEYFEKKDADLKLVDSGGLELNLSNIQLSVENPLH